MDSDNIVYYTKSCPDCKVMKSYLSALGVRFKEIEVNSDELINEVVNLTGKRKVPVLVTSKGIMSGFDREKIKSLI